MNEDKKGSTSPSLIHLVEEHRVTDLLAQRLNLLTDIHGGILGQQQPAARKKGRRNHGGHCSD